MLKEMKVPHEVQGLLSMEIVFSSPSPSQNFLDINNNFPVISNQLPGGVNMLSLDCS